MAPKTDFSELGAVPVTTDLSELGAVPVKTSSDFSDLGAVKVAEPKNLEIRKYEPAFSFKGLAKNVADFFMGKTDESEIANAMNMYSAFKKDVAASLDKPVKDVSAKDQEDFSFLDFAHEANKPLTTAMKNAYQVDRLNQKRGKLWTGAMFGDKTKIEAAKMIDSEIETEMQRHLDEYPEAKKFRQRNHVRHSLESAAGMASYMMNAQLSGVIPAAVAGLGTFAVTKNPGMTGKAAQIGMLIGSGVYTAQIEGGSIFGDLVKDHKIKNEETGKLDTVKGVDPDMARIPALVGGTINAVIEVAQQALIMRLPISKGMSFAQKLESLQSNPVTKRILNTFLAKVVQDVPQEAFEEATQAVTSEGVKNAAYLLDSIVKQRPYMGTTAGEVFKQAGEEGKEAMFGLAAFGLATQSVKSGAGRLMGKKPSITTAGAVDSVTVPPRETTQADALEAAKQRLAKLKFDLDPREEMAGPGGVKLPAYSGRIGTVEELEEVKFLEENKDNPEAIAKKYNLKIVETPQATPAMEGFKFKTAEEAVTYGKEIAGDEVKIAELQDERAALIESGKAEKDINAKYLILQKAQLLRDAIDEAQKVTPKQTVETPKEPEATPEAATVAPEQKAPEVAPAEAVEPQKADTSGVINTITGIEGLINKKGNLTRGTDHIRETFLKDQSPENLAALKVWAAAHKNPQVRRTVGSEIEALLRVAKRAEKKVTPQGDVKKKNPKTLYEIPEGAITEDEAKTLLMDHKEGDHPFSSTVREMRKEIAEGQPGFKWVNPENSMTGQEKTVFGYEQSTYPAYFQNKGYTKAASLKVIDAFLEKKPMTEKQKALLTELYNDKMEHLKAEAERYAEDNRRAEEENSRISEETSRIKSEIAESGVSSEEIEAAASAISGDQEGSSEDSGSDTNSEGRLEALAKSLEGRPLSEVTKEADVIVGKLLQAGLSSKDLVRDQYGKIHAVTDAGRELVEDAKSVYSEFAKQVSKGAQSLVPGAEKPTYKKAEFGAPKTIKQQDESALPLQQAANEAKQGGLFDAPEKESPKVVQDLGTVQANTDDKIDDVGEKIGGARKDTAVKTGPKGMRLNPELPGWRNRYVVAEGVYEQNKGKFTILDKRVKGRWGGNKSVGGWFDTKEEAEAAIPLAAVARNHRVYMNKEGKYEIWRDVSDRKRVKVLDQQFDSREDGMKYMALNAEAIIDIQTSFGEEILPRPDKVVRKGEDYRKGRDVAAEDFRQAFNFRAVEFGLWNNQEERQEVMNHAYDGLMDLAAVVGIPPSAIGLNGELALAFGARGQGLTGARAHYERDYGVINLTKMAGAGALAHEWFHATDHYFARLDTKAKAAKTDAEKGTPIYDPQGPERDYASHGFLRTGKIRPEVRAAYENLLKTMFFKAVKYKEDTQKADKFVGDAREDLKRELGRIRENLAKQLDTKYYKRKSAPASAKQLAKFDELANKLIAGEMLSTTFKASENKNARKWSMAGRYTNDALEAMSEIYKDVRGRSGFSSGQGIFDNLRSYMTRYDQRLKMLAEAQTGTEKERQAPTEYAMEAKSIDQGRASEYWTTEHEMAARAFSAYVEDKLKEKGQKSDFITYATNTVVPTPWGWKKPYPAGEERTVINAAFDALFNTLKTDEAGKMFYQEAGADLFSLAHFVAERKVANNANPGQILATLKNNGVKDEEIDWMGLPQWLEGKTKVSKAELLEFIRQNQVVIKEVVKGGRDQEQRIKEIESMFQSKRWKISQEMGGEIIVQDEQGDIIDDLDLEKSNPDLFNLAAEYSEMVGMEPTTGTKFSQYQLPGGENYREVLMMLPSTAKNPDVAYGYKDFVSGHWDEPNVLAHFRLNDRTIDGKNTLFVEEIQSDWHQKGREYGYKENPKTDQSIRGVVEEKREVGIKLNDLQTELRERLGMPYGTVGDNLYWLYNQAKMRDESLEHLSREEGIQEQKLIDSLKEGRNKLKELADKYEDLDGQEDHLRHGDTVVPNAPFKKTWHELALKRILRMAVEGGYDAIAWTTGEQQAERYDLSKQIESIRFERNNQGGYKLYIKYKQLNNFMEQSSGEDELANYVGKELAQKIKESARDTQTFSGLDLKVGGEGMKGFYDQMIPQFLNKYTKKWGGRVGNGVIWTEDIREYYGPEYTLDQLKDAKKDSEGYGDRFISPLTGEKQQFSVTRVSITQGLNRIIKSMESGSSFKDAVQGDYMSPDVTEYLGGEFKKTGASSEKVHALGITSPMRDSVLAGQPMFQTEPSAKASTFEAEAKKLNDLLEVHGVESVTIELADKILTPRGTKAFGAYDPAAEKVKMVPVPKATTGYHEGFHIVLGKAFSEDRIQDVLNEVKSELDKKEGEYEGFTTDREAEEYLAEKFARYANRRNSVGLSDKVIAFFEDLLYFIKRVMGFSSKTENLFNEMLHPDYYVTSAPVAHESAFYQEQDTPEENEARRNWKLSDRSKAIVQKYAARIGEGYVPRGNLGVFYPNTNNVFVQALNDISTVVHEVTHYLNKKYKLTPRVIATTGRGDKTRKEITRIYVNLYGKGNAKHKLSKRIEEGIAVLIENYAMNPEGTEAAYPDLVAMFLKPGGAYFNAEFAELVKDAQALMAEQKGIGALARIDSRVSNKKHKQAASTYFNLWDKVKSFFKDDLWRVEKLEIMKGVVGQSSPANWTRVLRNVGAMVSHNITPGKGFWSWREGEYKKVLDFNWGDLIGKTQAAGTSKVFGTWLVARRQYFMWKSLKDLPAQIKELEASLEDADPEEEAPEIIKQIKALKESAGKLGEVLAKDKFNRQDVEDVYMMFSEDFKDEAAMFDALVKSDIEMLADPQVMLLTPEQRDAMLQREGYATYHRDIYNDVLGEDSPGSAFKTSQKASFLKERYGSELDILNPLYGQLLNHTEALKKSLRQTVYNKLLKLAEQVPELFQRQALIAVPEADGSMSFPQLTDKHFFMARENYKRVPVLTNNEIMKLLDAALNTQNIDHFARVLLSVKRLFTVGTTSAFPPFAIVNFGRDQVTASALSVNAKFIPFYDSLNALRQTLLDQGSEEAKLAEEYFALGGERQTLAGIFNKEPGEVLEIVSREVNGHKNLIQALEKGVSILSAPAKYSEYGTRLAEYIMSRKAGKSQVEALEDAGRVSGAFHHAGSFEDAPFLGTLFKMVPFANANLQVTWAMLERFADANPKLRARAWAVFSAITALTVGGFASVLVFGDDDDKEQYKNIKAEMLSRYIYFPNPFGKGLVSFPIPQELGTLGAVINSILAQHLLDARYSTKEFVNIATAWIPDQFSPNIFEWQKTLVSWFPQPLAPIVSIAFNMKTFPEVEPIDRYPKYAGSDKYKNSSWVAINLGKIMNVSPKKIDYFIQGYFTRTTKFIPGLNPSEKGWFANSVDMFKGGIFRSYYFTAGRNITDYYEIKENTMSDWSAYTNKERDFKKDELEKLAWNRRILNKDKVLDRPGLNQLMQIYRELSEGDVSKDTERAQKLREAITRKISLLKR